MVSEIWIAIYPADVICEAGRSTLGAADASREGDVDPESVGEQSETIVDAGCEGLMDLQYAPGESLDSGSGR